ncbi:DUF3995 domain-containing protein [Embleya sp. AB8]|uniref:DUF3995 domain-containing protein n=1 Tax=Embleya sp. AB8 TaxID=3156304 RepID=UPI003C746027
MRTTAGTTTVDVTTVGTATTTVARRRAGIAVAALLAADGLAHAFWATGATWPATDTGALSRGLLNADVPFTPRVLLPLCALLTTAAVGVYAHSRGRGGRITALATAAVATGLAVRGTVGLVWALGIGADPGEPFYRLNLGLYTPICLGFGYVAARLAASGARRPTAGRRLRTWTTRVIGR